MNVQRTLTDDVLVVGGGLVGLSAALVLRHHGVGVTLVERRTASSPQPKARRFHMRTMEIFRELGLAATVHEAARELAGHDHMATGRTLAQARQLPLWQPGGDPAVEVSPELPCLIAQDALEPVLRAAAVDAGARVLFGTALTGFTERDDQVAAALGDGRRLAARYLVAADGAHSPVRAALGIGRSGRGAVGAPSVNVYFGADLGAVVAGREFNLCGIEHPDAPGTLASVDGRYRWVFSTPGPDTDRDWPALLRTALGVPVPDLAVHSVLAWRSEMLVADAYRHGRVLLAGDAAHVMPPFAASGANTGIADVHNLAWKLAAVLRGESAPALLDSYDTERRPAGWFMADQSTRRTQSFTARATAPDLTLAHPYVLAVGVPQYTAGVLTADQVTPEPVTDFAPAGRVGTRVPHRWLAPARSTVDLAGPDWAVLPGTAVDFLAEDESALLRPDHVVAWRGPAADAARARAALRAGPVPSGAA